ncbi:MAG: hypothetical protein V1781_09315 [Bacteroidota bacterium]
MAGYCLGTRHGGLDPPSSYSYQFYFCFYEKRWLHLFWKTEMEIDSSFLLMAGQARHDELMRWRVKARHDELMMAGQAIHDELIKKDL